MKEKENEETMNLSKHRNKVKKKQTKNKKTLQNSPFNNDKYLKKAKRGLP